jgi:aspartate aminotransferase
MKKAPASLESATLLINSLVQQKIAAGARVFNLSVGEPRLPPHQILIDATMHALQEGKTLYPPVAGIPKLRELATQWMNKHYQASLTKENCLVSCGGKFGIYLLLQSQLKKHDEVLIPSPYWVSYPTIVEIFGGTPKFIETQEKTDWKLKPNALEKACTPKTKILILNNGGNPTGVLYTQKELSALLKIAKKHGLLVISDEVYSGLTYDSEAYISCASFKEYQDNVVIIQSCSKNFAMTGWRIGFVFAPIPIIKNLSSLTTQSTTGVITIGQYAAMAAFENYKKINSLVKKTMQKRRDVLISALNKEFKINLSPPASALYAFVSLQDLGMSHLSSSEFCAQALEQANVASVPGIAFGKEGFVRFSFGAEEAELKAGVKALAEFCKAK